MGAILMGACETCCVQHPTNESLVAAAFEQLETSKNRVF